MRKSLFATMTAVCVIMLFWTIPSGSNSSVNERKTDPPSVQMTENVSGLGTKPANNWLASIQECIQRNEYMIHKDLSNSIVQSFNRAHQLHATYTPDKMQIKPLNNADWEINFTIKGFGRNQQVEMKPSSVAKPDISTGDTVRYVEPGKLAIEYINNEAGLRQNFYLFKRPAGRGNLQLSIDVLTDLDVTQADVREIQFFDNKQNDSEKKLVYNGLKAWDKNLRELPATFRIAQNSITIEVDDKDAVYPIVIDPLSTSAKWTVTAPSEGILFGCSVASAGDVNGDGFDDIIVGAKAFENAAGAAFLYYGSASGQAGIPSGKLLVIQRSFFWEVQLLRQAT